MNEIAQHTVTYGTRDGEAVATVELRRTYTGGIEDVWDALTNPERLPRWFLPVSGDLREGGQYQFEGNAGGTITSCDAPRSFTSTWEMMGFVSWLAVDLTADGDDRTVVRLAHTAATDNDHWRTFGPAATGIGWDLGFHGLGLHLSTGASLDPEHEQTWTVSPEGIAWVTRCGESWYAADTAGGATETDARSRADACVAFYTTIPDATADALPNDAPGDDSQDA